MATINMRKVILALVLTGSGLTLAACDPSAVSVGGSVYYDSMMWNDYYYNRPGYRPPRPPPVKPVHPIAPRPPVGRPPVARPPVARPPIHRPSPRLR